jgi:hypothetical protein
MPPYYHEEGYSSLKNKSIHFLLASLLCIACSSKAEASGLCCQLSSGVQESLAGVAAPGTEEVSLQMNYSFTRMDKFKEGSTTRSLDEAKAYIKPDGTSYTSVPISMDMMRFALTAGYGFSSRFKAFVSLPYVRNTMEMTSSQGAMLGWMDMTMEPTSGVGDATVMGLYRLYTNRDIRPTDVVTLGLGLKAPTGSYTERSSNGRLIHAHMQPGTGSWDPLLSVMYTSMAGQFLLQADATYQYTTRNSEGYEFGDSAAVNLAARYAVMKELGITAGLTYLHVGRASDKNGAYYDPVTNSSLMDDPANTGGDSIWFSPGMQVFPMRNLALDAKVQLPVWERVNGIQLVSSYSVLAGISYSF